MALPSTSDTSRGTHVPVSIPPLTAEEEDRIILARITNDERPLRRVIKKFHSYASLAQTPIVPPAPGTTTPTSLDDAREAFLVELASYQLALKKSAMICDAETRQVDEYQREKERIEQDHITLRRQIEELKVALEHAQMLRRRKIEYDTVAEKINTLPPRDELEESIEALENDMAAIRAEQETQSRIMQTQKVSLEGFIADLKTLRSIGKDKEEKDDETSSARATPIPDGTDDSVAGLSAGPLARATSSFGAQSELMSVKGNDDDDDDASPRNTDGSKEDDIEMGEVEEEDEEPRDKSPKKKARDEELEEGEASDFGSDLSDPPDE